MRKRALWLGVCGVFGALWMAGSGGDLRAGDVDVMGMLRRLQARFVTLDARVAEIKDLGQAAKQQADTAKLQADAAKQASERAVQEAKAAKQQAAQEAAQARKLVEAAQRAAEAAEEKVSQAIKQVEAAKQTVQAAQKEAAEAKEAAQSAKKETSETKESLRSLEKRLQDRVAQLEKETTQRFATFLQRRKSVQRKQKAAEQQGHFEVNGVRFRGRWIPAGSFLMGSPEGEVGRDSDEGPQRKVQIIRGFWMMESEVTQGLYKAVMGSNPSRFSLCGDRCPVEQVSWHEAAFFANSLSEKTDLPKCFVCSGKGEGLHCEGVGNKKSDYIACAGWRLPTEAEWEYAARAGTHTTFHTGGCISTENANYDGSHLYGDCSRGESRGKTIAVCSFPRNPWSLCDMHGNVGEWGYDGYKDTAYKNAGLFDPVYAFVRRERVIRGGHFDERAKRLRSASRFWSNPKARSREVGFRLLVR